MPGIAVKDLDTAGGRQQAGGQTVFKVGGKLAVVKNDPVEPHGGDDEVDHNSARMTEATQSFRINGKPTCRQDHAASCGHRTTGRTWFKIP